MKKIYNMIFSKNNKNIEQKPPIIINENIEQKPPIIIKAKCCSYCGENNHTISKCDIMNNKLQNMVNYCSEYENQINIPKTKLFLEKIDKKVIKRYITQKNIRIYMYHNCSQYYDHSVNNDIDLIIGFLCILPLHPEIKIPRQISSKTTTTKPKPHIGLFLNSSGLDVGLIL